jgi:hypothetical protein
MDLMALASSAALKSQMAAAVQPEEELAAEAEALEAGDAAVTAAAAALPRQSSTAAALQIVDAQIDAVLQCVLESLRRNKLRFPEKVVPPMLMRVASTPAASVDAPAATSPDLASSVDLEARVSALLHSMQLQSSVVELSDEEVHAIFKPFPSSAEKRALAGRYVRVEPAALSAFLLRN